jgi:MOSC domain-containing protein YiiM
MRIESLNVGRAAALVTEGGTVQSAIVKSPVERPLHLGLRGFAEDDQADKRHHGSPDQAVCVYPSEHYAAWGARLGRPVNSAAFGENVTATGWLEADARPGDTLRLGGALVQVSGGRAPCSKLAARNGEPRLTVWVRESGLTGFYLRVLEEGTVAPGDSIELMERNERGVTVFELNRLIYVDTDDVDAIESALASEGMLDALRRQLERNLARAAGA